MIESSLSAPGVVPMLETTESAFEGGRPSGVALFSTVAMQSGMPFHASMATATGR